MKLINKIFSKQKKITIEFCQKNLDRYLDTENFSRYNAFLNQKNINYKEYECQSKCGDCQKGPYAIVNGQFISAEDSEALLEKLKSCSEHQRNSY